MSKKQRREGAKARFRVLSFSEYTIAHPTNGDYEAYCARKLVEATALGI